MSATVHAPHGLRIAVTGFGPFPGVPFNASRRLIAELVEAPPRLPHGAKLYAAALPTNWRLGPETLTAFMDAVKPHIALHFGVSARAKGFVIETRAYNQTSIRPDCEGCLAQARRLRRGGPPFLDTLLPAGRLVQRLRMEGIAARLSADPGRYLCNAVMFESLCRAGMAASEMRRETQRGLGASKLRKHRRVLGSRLRGDFGSGRGNTVQDAPTQRAIPITGFVHIPALMWEGDEVQPIAGFGWTELRRGAAVILDTLASTARSGHGAGLSGRPCISFR